MLTAFEHVDTHDVGTGRTDAGRDETERSRPIGEPDADDDVSFHAASVRCRVVTERLGILGGTFDPVHTAHLVAAVEARHQLDLDRVLLVVAGDPWQKRGQVAVPAQTRHEMVTAAIDGIAGLEASSIEIDREGPTYTIDTVEQLSAPARELFLVLGFDAVAGLGTWHRTDDLRDRVTLALVDRTGVGPEPPPGWNAVRVEIPRLDISSTDVRGRIARGAPIDGLVPPAVVRMIRERHLYNSQ
jgi:nicotinate-nucleotide adenylyltransferase